MIKEKEAGTDPRDPDTDSDLFNDRVDPPTNLNVHSYRTHSPIFSQHTVPVIFRVSKYSGDPDYKCLEKSQSE